MKLTQDITFDRQRGLIDTIFLKLYVDKSFPDKYKSAIINSMNQCAVKRQLHSDIGIESEVIKLG